MADVQKYFTKFHGIIKLDNFNENATLRDKRKIILDKLKDQLKKMHEDNKSIPKTFDWFNQGSYALGTGINPDDDDYDIDVGIIFDVSMEDFAPIDIKSWVYNALLGHTKSVMIKKPCITVQYSKKDEKTYHVDLALYVKQPVDYFNNDKMYFSMGKSKDDMEWENCEPKKLTDRINSLSEVTEQRSQFRRVVRFLKYWSKENFTSSGNGAPPSIGLTLCAYNWISYNEGDDLEVLINLAQSILNNFAVKLDSNYNFIDGFELKLPTLPYSNVFRKMTSNQITNFKDKIKRLQSILTDAKNESDPYDACLKLQNIFGEKFPAEKKDTAKKTASTSNWGSTNNASL